MNLGIIPIVMSVAICIACGVAAVLGGVLLVDRHTRPLGRKTIGYARIALVFAYQKESAATARKSTASE